MKYDVALSFAGEDREYVEAVATELKNLGVRVFYDNFETVDLWGKDLYAHLQNVYQKEAKYTVIFISEHYAKKLWTNHERKSAQARAFKESSEYILPARFDDTEIEGILPTTGFIDLRSLTSSEFSGLISQKLNGEISNLVNSTDSFNTILEVQKTGFEYLNDVFDTQEDLLRRTKKLAKQISENENPLDVLDKKDFRLDLLTILNLGADKSYFYIKPRISQKVFEVVREDFKLDNTSILAVAMLEKPFIFGYFTGKTPLIFSDQGIYFADYKLEPKTQFLSYSAFPKSFFAIGSTSAWAGRNKMDIYHLKINNSKIIIDKQGFSLKLLDKILNLIRQRISKFGN